MKKHIQKQFLKSNEDLTLEDILNYSKSSSPVKMVSIGYESEPTRVSPLVDMNYGNNFQARKIAKKFARSDQTNCSR